MELSEEQRNAVMLAVGSGFLLSQVVREQERQQ